jgi:hypothetical protein
MNFTQFINKIDNLPENKINYIYSKIYSPLHYKNYNNRKDYIKYKLNDCQNDYEKNKILLQDIKYKNDDNVLNYLIPSKLRFYSTYKESIELQKKIKQCETLNNFCLKLCVDISIN